MPLDFRVVGRDPGTRARLGRAQTDHGPFDTPAFMPVGTRASVKGMTPADLALAGARIVLANAFHLALRPGEQRVRELGGLHGFMAWPGPILTDSGGYQVFSLGGNVRIFDDRVVFRSPVDGTAVEIGPARAMEIQRALGADLVMAFDQCGSFPMERDEADLCVRRTLRWARISRDAPLDPHQAVLGIVQGGIHLDLRAECARQLVEMDFPAYAVGGLMVGEPQAEAMKVLAATLPSLPEDRLRYLMGVGLPEDIVLAVARGIDLFDCVIPTRHARNNHAFTSEGVLNLKNARFKDDRGPLDPQCPCYACRTFTRAYLAHLARENELLAPVLLTAHNVTFYQRLMQRIRETIAAGTFGELVADQRPPGTVSGE
ncbi:MAG: tRNA guanosine(34) transglycosylase Tgt [Planctomycetes bacterium]|nr:tRNA guanosine(34) transglycosylase Tgt [Planctomycetota bacterium]